MRKHDSSRVAAAVGRVVRARRRKIGISSSALALLGDVDRTFLSQIERGLRQPTINTFLKISRQLQIKPERLMALVMRDLEPEPRHKQS